tara:strand:+ start:5085 stop:5750 length:666 start_codon:yes stop_codon:yes gene_type:complete
MFSITPEFFCGACNGISQALVGHPLDTIKVLQQNNVPWKSLKFIELMRGVKYPLYYKIVTKSLCFDLDKRINIKNDFARNAVVGLYLAPFTHALDLFKIYRQNDRSIKQISYYDIVNYRAFLCTVTRDMLSYSFYIPTFMIMKKNDYNTVVSASVSGFVNWSISYPIDVIRTRQISNNQNTLRDSINMGSLWKGYNACATRGALTAVVGFLVYENMIKLFK